MKVAAHLESPRLFGAAGLHRLEAGRADQPLDFLAGPVVVAADRPESAGWIASMVRAAPAAYLGLMYTRPGERAAGVGAALAAALHQDIDAASVAVTLLHYEQINPLSAPFWSRQGYRPLWTTWEARPARSIR